MSLTSWFSFGARQNGGSQDGQHKDEALALNSFDDIAVRFSELNDEVLRLQGECARQAQEIRNYIGQTQICQRQLTNLREEVYQEIEAKTKLQNAIANQQDLQKLRKQGSSKPFIQLLKNERREQQNRLQKARDQHAASNSQCIAMQKQIALMKQQLSEAASSNENLKFDLEYLKCTTKSEAVAPSSGSRLGLHTVEVDTPLLQVPFVLVLVDGDAYSFTDMLPGSYTNSPMHPATSTAHNIKKCLQKYILSNSLPAHSKLMVRILINRGSGPNPRSAGSKRRGQHAASAIDDFMLRFTEFAPLFEFIDVGTGKERVDSKIHELYHTFIPNPACHKIFLATARDNGFARMLEQQIHHPEARAKTCLISAGDIGLEIEKLKLETVEWPTVFARQYRPKAVANKLAKQERHRLSIEAEAEEQKTALIEKLGVDGYEDFLQRRGYQALTRELIGTKHIDVLWEDIATMDRRRLGLRTLTSFNSQADPNAGDSDGIYGHDDGVCIDAGVD